MIKDIRVDYLGTAQQVSLRQQGRAAKLQIRASEDSTVGHFRLAEWGISGQHRMTQI